MLVDSLWLLPNKWPNKIITFANCFHTAVVLLNVRFTFIRGMHTAIVAWFFPMLVNAWGILAVWSLCSNRYFQTVWTISIKLDVILIVNLNIDLKLRLHFQLLCVCTKRDREVVVPVTSFRCKSAGKPVESDRMQRQNLPLIPLRIEDARLQPGCHRNACHHWHWPGPRPGSKQSGRWPRLPETSGPAAVEAVPSRCEGKWAWGSSWCSSTATLLFLVLTS